jgi:hypothetical protein
VDKNLEKMSKISKTYPELYMTRAILVIQNMLKTSISDAKW